MCGSCLRPLRCRSSPPPGAASLPRPPGCAPAPGPRVRGRSMRQPTTRRPGGRVGGRNVLLHPGAEVVDDRPNRLLRFHLCREGREGEVPGKTRQKAVPDRTSRARGPDGAGRRHRSTHPLGLDPAKNPRARSDALREASAGHPQMDRPRNQPRAGLRLRASCRADGRSRILPEPPRHPALSPHCGKPVAGQDAAGRSGAALAPAARGEEPWHPTGRPYR